MWNRSHPPGRIIVGLCMYTYARDSRPGSAQVGWRLLARSVVTVVLVVSTPWLVQRPRRRTAMYVRNS